MATEPLGRLAAVLLTAPAGAVASHRTAAALWGLKIPMQDPADRRIDLTVPTTSRAGSRGDRRIYRCDLPSDDVTRRGSMPVTTLARTWRDLAGVLQPAALLAVTDQALFLGCTPTELQTQLERRPAGRGSARARLVLPLGNKRAESPMESVVRWLVHAAGLPDPVVQFEMYDDAGFFLGRGDLAWPDHRLLVEFDGDGHRERKVFAKDLRRQNSLIVDRWTVLRFSGADVYGRPDGIVEQIRHFLP